MSDELIHCPSCTHQLRVPAELMGQQVECPQCHARFTAPMRSEAAPPLVAPAQPSYPRDYAPTFADDPQALAFRAANSLRIPAIVLIIFVLLAAGFDVRSILTADAAVQDLKDLAQDPNLPPEFAKLLERIADAALPQTIRNVHTVMLVLNVIMLAGAVQMLRLRMYWLAMIGAVLALNPLNCPCCFLDVPIGIWALVVLLNADVRAAFR